MINLSKRIMKPSILFFNFVFFWMYGLMIVACVMDEYLWAAAMLLLVILGNCTVAFFTSRSAKSGKYWLVENDNTITIRYPNVWHDLDPLTLNMDQIVKMEYYRLFSLSQLLDSAPNTVPQAVYITFFHNGKQWRRCIGHPNLNEITALCKKHEIPFELRY